LGKRINKKLDGSSKDEDFPGGVGRGVLEEGMGEIEGVLKRERANKRFLTPWRKRGENRIRGGGYLTHLPCYPTK